MTQLDYVGKHGPRTVEFSYKEAPNSLRWGQNEKIQQFLEQHEQHRRCRYQPSNLWQVWKCPPGRSLEDWRIRDKTLNDHSASYHWHVHIVSSNKEWFQVKLTWFRAQWSLIYSPKSPVRYWTPMTSAYVSCQRLRFLTDPAFTLECHTVRTQGIMV